jgi:hypothetical protein
VRADFQGSFEPNKKWAVSPLISPPAGVYTVVWRTNSSAYLYYGDSWGDANGCEQIDDFLGELAALMEAVEVPLSMGAASVA